MPTAQNNNNETIDVAANGTVRVNPTRLILLLLSLAAVVIGLTAQYLYADISERIRANDEAAKAANAIANATAAHSAVIDEQIKHLRETVEKVDRNVDELLRRTK